MHTCCMMTKSWSNRHICYNRRTTSRHQHNCSSQSRQKSLSWTKRNRSNGRPFSSCFYRALAWWAHALNLARVFLVGFDFVVEFDFLEGHVFSRVFCRGLSCICNNYRSRILKKAWNTLSSRMQSLQNMKSDWAKIRQNRKSNWVMSTQNSYRKMKSRRNS